jgi:RND family efflux transporter MFP subunit
MSKRVLYPLLVLVIGLGLAYTIAVNEPAPAVEPYQPPAPTVRVTEARAQDEYLSIKSQGTVQPRTQSELIPEVNGRVVWMSAALVGGGSFREGEVFEYAEDEKDRLTSLHGKQLASQQQMDNARRAAQVAEANLVESRAALEQAERDLSRTELRAPFDGLVRNEQVDMGQFVTRGQSIGIIYATDYAEVRLPLSTDQLVYLDLPISTSGQIPEAIRPPVRIYAWLGERRLEWEGQLMRLEAEIDERSRMLYGVARLRQDSSEDRPIIPSGLFVQASIRGLKAEQVFRLPRSAMRDDNQVLIVDRDNRLRFRRVSILRLEHDDMLIDGGLADGERVCISPLQTVVDGMTVTPVSG